MTLRATTCLAENTDSMLRRWMEHLQGIGIDIEFDEGLTTGERLAMASSGEVDVLFACGLLTMELIALGTPLDVVAAPVFESETEPVYRSVVICRADSAFESVADAANLRLAVNEYASWSGWHGLRAYLQSIGLTVGDKPGGPFGSHMITGSHAASIEAVRSGRADVAAIDHSLWSYLVATDHDRLDGLAVVAQTSDWPAPPVTINTRLDGATREALSTALKSTPGLRAASHSAYEFMLQGR